MMSKQPQSKNIVLLCILCGMLSGAIAGFSEPRMLTYDQAIAIALSQSYTVQSFQARLESMEYSFEHYRAQFRPRLDFSMFAPTLDERVSPVQRPDGLPVYNSNGILRVGGDLKFTYMLPTGGNLSLASQLYRERISTVLALQDYEELETDQASSSLTLSFEQPIFTDNTLRENLDEARYRYEQTLSQFTRAQMDIIYQVTEGYYYLYRATRRVQIANEKLANSEEAYRIAKLYQESGRIAENEVLIAEIEMSRNRAALVSEESMLERERDDFTQLIGLPADEEIIVETEITYDTFEIDLERAIAQAQENRLELKESELSIELQKIDLERAERTKEFKGNVSAYYDLTGVSTLGSGNTRELFDSSFENFSDRPPNRGISLTFSYPIFDWGRGKARVQQETVNLREEQLSRDNLRRTIEKDVKATVRQVNEARLRLEINEQNEQIAQRSYDISRLQFENGDITSQELGREQERLADTRLAYLDAFITYQLAVNDLKRKTLWDFKENRSYLLDASVQEMDQ